MMDEARRNELEEVARRVMDEPIRPQGEPVLSLVRGDQMRMTFEFVDMMQERRGDRTLLVRVLDIRQIEDGTLLLVLENAADESPTGPR